MIIPARMNSPLAILPVTDHIRDTLPVWKLAWLSPLRCRLIFAALLAFGFLSHLWYLHNCPIDLLGDEAQYWDWSRQLDISYYSKGPLVAYIIRASCAMFGETMPAVRYPALVLGAGTSVFFYLTAKRIFASERLALGTVLLTHGVPMFIAGSVLMTIDPPFFFCWAGATFFAAGAVFDEKRWNWIVAGLFIGIGFLAKYAALLWWPGVLIFLILDRTITKKRDPTSSSADPLAPSRFFWPVVGTIISLLFTLPVILWNHHHDWVTFRHVARQTGASGGGISNGNLFEFIGGQVGIIGPTLAVLMIAAIHQAMRQKPIDRRHLFLAVIGLFFFACTLMTSLIANVQQNWAAPAYFTLIILTAAFIGGKLASIHTWKIWRRWVWATIILGVIVVPILHDITLVVPLASKLGISPERIDFATKARGWEELGRFVSQKRREMGTDPLVMCDDYLQTAEMAFYVDGQPKTFYAGSYFTDPKRHTQYDLWQDRSLSRKDLVGRDAVYVGKGGKLPPDIPAAFERVSERIELPIVARGVIAKTFKVWMCYRFKGMKRPEHSDY